MNDDLKTLQTRYGDATVARVDVVGKRDAERTQRLDAARREIDADLEARYGVLIRQAFTTEHDSKKAVEDERIRLGRERLRGMNYGVLVQWKSDQRNWYDPEKRHLKFRTGKRGQLEVRDHASKFPATKTYGLPDMGEIFLRHIKRDGTVGLPFTRLWGDASAGEMHTRLPSDWLPEGDKPERAGE